MSSQDLNTTVLNFAVSFQEILFPPFISYLFLKMIPQNNFFDLLFPGISYSLLLYPPTSQASAVSNNGKE